MERCSVFVNEVKLNIKYCRWRLKVGSYCEGGEHLLDLFSIALKVRCTLHSFLIHRKIKITFWFSRHQSKHTTKRTCYFLAINIHFWHFHEFFCPNINTLKYLITELSIPNCLSIQKYLSKFNWSKPLLCVSSVQNSEPLFVLLHQMLIVMSLTKLLIIG